MAGSLFGAVAFQGAVPAACSVDSVGFAIGANVIGTAGEGFAIRTAVAYAKGGAVLHGGLMDEVLSLIHAAGAGFSFGDRNVEFVVAMVTCGELGPTMITGVGVNFERVFRGKLGLLWLFGLWG